MWTVVLTGTALAGCARTGGDAIRRWQDMFWDGKLALPPIQFTALNMSGSVCSTASEGRGGVYNISVNPGCSCGYQVAAVGHVLQHVANSTWSSPTANILSIPLHQTTINSASVRALHVLGRARTCNSDRDCVAPYRCVPGNPGLCKGADERRVLFVVGLLCLVIPLFLVGLCAARSWVEDGDHKDTFTNYAEGAPCLPDPTTGPADASADPGTHPLLPGDANVSTEC